MITYSIMAACIIMSLMAMNDPVKFRKWELHPYTVIRNKEYYRILTHAFIHAGWGHLFINMFVFWQFGTAVESSFLALFGTSGYLYYAVLYIGAMAVAALPALKKHSDNFQYRSVGASGAVAAVLFSYIVLYPLKDLYFFAVLPIPAIILGVLYLFYESRMENADDNIAHDAHFKGAVFGAVATVLFKPSLALDFFNEIWSGITGLLG